MRTKSTKENRETHEENHNKDKQETEEKTTQNKKTNRRRERRNDKKKQPNILRNIQIIKTKKETHIRRRRTKWNKQDNRNYGKYE